MWKRLKAYIARVDALLAANDPATDWPLVQAEHLAQISFFQHERLVHLLVTLAFALMELIAAVTTLVLPQALTAALALLLLVLLVPYVVHYYHLENGTQRLYEQYDRIADKTPASHEAETGPHEAGPVPAR